LFIGGFQIAEINPAGLTIGIHLKEFLILGGVPTWILGDKHAADWVRLTLTKQQSPVGNGIK
jgi:hypothetical protein